MSDHRNEVQIGLFAIIAVLLLAMMILVFGGFKDFLANTYVVKAKFRDAVGTTDGTPVRLLGIDIGRVKRIALAPDNNGVEMKVEIRDDVNIPIGAPLAIKQEGFIANIYLEFSAPPAGAPHAFLPKDGSAVVSGEIHTFSAYVENATSAVAEVSRKLSGNVGGLSEGLISLTKSINDLLGDEQFRKDLKSMAANANALTGELKDRVPGILDDFDAAAKNVQASLAKSSELLDTYRKLGEELRGTNTLAQDQITRQGANLDKLEESLVETADNISQLAMSLNDIATAVHSGQGSLGKLITDEDLYRSVVQAVDTLSGAAAEFKDLANTIKRHPDWVIKGRPQEK